MHSRVDKVRDEAVGSCQGEADCADRQRVFVSARLDEAPTGRLCAVRN
jgi:hypothetical protein